MDVTKIVEYIQEWNDILPMNELIDNLLKQGCSYQEIRQAINVWMAENMK